MINNHDALVAKYEELTDEMLIQIFYCHDKTAYNLTEDEKSSERLIGIFLRTKTERIINLIKNANIKFNIKKKDIPQFSDIEVVANVPFVLKNCGIDGVSYEQMGYMVRRDRRSVVADRKYGENHMKTAYQMSLCKIVGYKAYPNALGNFFSSLPPNDKRIVFPKFCLSIPFIQNYFMNGCNNDYLEQQMSILSESTIGRRRPNVNTLISLINEAIRDGV